MTDSEVKLSIQDRIKLISFGFKLAHKMVPTYFFFTTARSFITALQPMLVLFFSARILNELAGAQNINILTQYAVLTLGLSFILQSLRVLISREVETYSAWERLYSRMQLMQAEKFTQMDYAHAEDSKISEVLARMDTQARGNGLGLMNIFFQYVSISQSFFSLVFAYLLMSVFSLGSGSGNSGLILLFMISLGTFISFRYSAKAKVILDNMYKENAKANTAAQFYNSYLNVENAAKDIRLYDQKDILLDIFKHSFNLKSWMKFFFFGSRQQGSTQALNALIGGAFFLLVGYYALNGSIPIGAVIQQVGAITGFAGAFGTFTYVAAQMWTNAAFLKPMQEFHKLPDILIKGDREIPKKESRDYVFEFRNVSFKYPGAEKYALNGINLNFRPGERLAVVGLNGSGKTTMIKLLCRLYDPTEGEILLDGINIKEYDYAQYTSLFSVVFQDYTLFPLWLGQNVAVSENFDSERIIDSLEKAGFSQRLKEMPEGLDTILYKNFDKDGVQVSGGEAQKIALARALYKDAPIVVLDEPTAALDPIAEYEVYSTFEHTIGNKTAVFISHRLSSCRFCGRIAVFDSGKLVQLGTHEELLEDNAGRYHELWEAQASHYRDD